MSRPQDITYSNLQVVVQTLELPRSVERSIVIDSADSMSIEIETLAFKFQARGSYNGCERQIMRPLIQALLRDQIRNPNDLGTLGQGMVEAAHFGCSRCTMDRPLSTAHI